MNNRQKFALLVGVLYGIPLAVCVTFLHFKSEREALNFEPYVRRAREVSGSNCIQLSGDKSLEGWYCIKYVGKERPKSEFMGHYLKGN